LQEFRRFDDYRNCKILWSATLQPVSLAPEIGDTVPERRNRCLLIHEKHHYSLLPIRILSVGNPITRSLFLQPFFYGLLSATSLRTFRSAWAMCFLFLQ